MRSFSYRNKSDTLFFLNYFLPHKADQNKVVLAVQPVKRFSTIDHIIMKNISKHKSQEILISMQSQQEVAS